MGFHSVIMYSNRNDSFPKKRLSFHDERDDAMRIACGILHKLIRLYREEIYVFMENGEFVFEGMKLKGCFIYNGNIEWTLFVSNAFVTPNKIGPLGNDKYKNFSISSEDN